MQAKHIGQFIGAASLTFGITDILLGKVFGRGIGAGAEEGGKLFRSVGVREVATGIAGLSRPESSGPVWTRFAADLGDIATLGAIVARPNPKRKMAALALGIVAGVAAVDYFAAKAIDRATAGRKRGADSADHAFGFNGE